MISGNGGGGIFIGAPATGTSVLGNYIGVNPAGTAALANSGDGIIIRSTGNTIGGTTAGTGNVISGNLNDGIDFDAGANNNVVAGNRIGTNAAGTAAIPNTFRGIWMTGGVTGNVVGGTSTGARNVLSGNNSGGISLNGAGTTGNTVIGNFIGTNAAGTAAVPNGGYGVDTRSGASGNTIGGVQAVEGNVISGNSLSGVAFLGAATDVGGNTLVGNLIGTDAAGSAAIGNALQGVFVQTSNNRIGSLASGIGNTIAFNGQVGVRVESGTGNAILNNSIHSNGTLGIDHGPLGVTANDAGDGDTGVNNLQNFPVLTPASGGVQGTLNSAPNSTFRIEFFGNTACDAVEQR